jgi:GNAT superfamily N-acetyltransferase
VSIESYVIRRAEPDDISALPIVERRAVRQFGSWLAETGLTPAILEDVSDARELEDAGQRGHLWVAVRPNAEIIGFAQVMVLDNVAHLDELDVVPEHSRRGVGSLLLATVCTWAREAGYPTITLTTFRDVPWNRPFYERRGFTVIDSRELGPEHLALIAAEQARGLRTDRRVMMEYRLVPPVGHR